MFEKMKRKHPPRKHTDNTRRNRCKARQLKGWDNG